MMLNSQDVQELIKDFPLQPMFGKVIITLNNLENDGQLVLSDNVLSDVQYVLAKGTAVREIELGQKVIIDIEKMMVPVKSESNNAYEMQMQVKIDPIQVGENTFAIIEDRYIKCLDFRQD